MGIVGVEPVDSYAIRPLLSDGHDSGIFGWAYLCRLDIEHGALWQTYLDHLAATGVDHDVPTAESAGHACGHSH